MKKLCRECGSEVDIDSFEGWNLCIPQREMVHEDSGVRKVIRLTRMELVIMHELMRVLGKPVPTRTMLSAMYGRYKPSNPVSALRVITCKLRRKLVGSGLVIVSRYDLGYYLGTEEGV